MSEGEAAAAVETAGAEATGGEATPVPSASEAVATAGEAAPETPSWANGLDTDSVAFIQNKGWDKAENPVSEMLKSYRNTERLRGVSADQLVRIPEQGNEEQMAEWRTRLGVPETPDGYELGDIKANGQDVDKGVVAGIAHRIGATPQQAQELAGAVAEFVEQSAVAQHEALNAEMSAQKTQLDKDWGPELEANTLAAKKGFGVLGWDGEAIDAVERAIGYRGVMELGAMLGRLTAEPSRGDTGGGAADMPFGLTAAAARDQLKLKGNELMARAQGGDAAAKRELDQLNTVAFHSN